MGLQGGGSAGRREAESVSRSSVPDGWKSLCEQLASACVHAFAQVHATGLEIIPVSPLFLEFVIIFFF